MSPVFVDQAESLELDARSTWVPQFVVQEESLADESDWRLVHAAGHVEDTFGVTESASVPLKRGLTKCEVVCSGKGIRVPKGGSLKTHLGIDPWKISDDRERMLDEVVFEDFIAVDDGIPIRPNIVVVDLIENEIDTATAVERGVIRIDREVFQSVVGRGTLSQILPRPIGRPCIEDVEAIGPLQGGFDQAR